MAKEVTIGFLDMGLVGGIMEEGMLDLLVVGFVILIIPLVQLHTT
jgi:hypothetical protein